MGRRSMHELNDIELLDLYERLAEHAEPGLAMVSQELANRRAQASLARMAQLPERLLRAVAFVDAGYLRNLGARALGCSPAEVHIDGAALREWLHRLAEPFRFMRGYVYDGRYPPEHPKASVQAAQLDELADTSQIRLRLGVLRERDRGRSVEQKGVDTLLVLDALQMAQVNAYDIAFLVAGDADFAEVVDAVQRLGRTVAVVVMENLQAVSKDLRQAADEFPLLEAKELKALVRRSAVSEDERVGES